MAETASIRAIHILSDNKFLLWARTIFMIPNWSSSYIVVSKKSTGKIRNLGEDIIAVPENKFGKQFILSTFQNTDIVFYYLLDKFKSDIILLSPPKIVHCWLFYGAEIYKQTGLFRKFLYGPETERWLFFLPEIRFRYFFRKIYYLTLRFEKPPIASLTRSIQKVRFILWYVPDEIERLREVLKLPPWRFFQFFTVESLAPTGSPFVDKNSTKILVGNSATIENNHADILLVLRKLELKHYQLTLPLTYGQFSRYKSILKYKYKKYLSKNVQFLDAHLPLPEYYDLLHQHPTAIFLHYRQQGLGNILYLIYTGAKVYLSTRSVVYEWLKKNQIFVFPFEDQFVLDFRTDNLTLSPDLMKENRSALTQLLQHKRNYDTLFELEQIIVNKKIYK